MAWELNHRLRETAAHRLANEPTPQFGDNVERSSGADGFRAPVNDARGELLQLAMVPNGRSVWPEPEGGSGAMHSELAHTVADRRRGEVPPRPHPDAEERDWPTQSRRDWQRLKDFWDSMPLGETALEVTGLLGVGLIVGAVVARFAPLVFAALKSTLGAKLGAALTATAVGVYFNQWFDAAWTASDDPGKREQKIEEGREAFKRLGHAFAAAKLQGTLNQAGAAEAQTSNLPVPLANDSSLVPIGSAVANRAIDALTVGKHFGIQGTDGTYYPTPSGGSFEPGERGPGSDRLLAVPDFSRAHFNNLASIESRMNRELTSVKVLPLKLQLNQNAGEQFAFSAEDWAIRVDSLILKGGASNDWWEPRLKYAFARAMQSWEVIRYMHQVGEVQPEEIERYFAKHAVAAAIADTSPMTDEQRVRAEILLRSIEESHAALATVKAKNAERERLAESYNSLSKTLSASKTPLTQDQLDQHNKARWAWHDAHLGAMKAGDELAKFPHERTAMRGNAIPYEAADELAKPPQDRVKWKADRGRGKRD